MPYATHGGCRLFWERDGDEAAPALLLVRGLARSSRYWGDLRGRLARSFHLVVTDNRGVGRSDAPWPPYSTAQMADDQAAVLEAAGVARAHLFGMSLGGMIAQEIALRHPTRVDRLVLGCTTPGGPHAERARSGVRALVRAAVAPVDRAMRIMAPFTLSATTLRDRPEVVDGWTAIANEEPKRRRGVVGQLLAASRHDTWSRLPRISAKTLVVTGDADTLIPPSNSRILAERIPGARLQMIEGAGHDFPADRPEESAEALEGFLLG